MADAGDLKARALLENAEFMGALKQMVDGTTDAVTKTSQQFDSMTSAVGGVFDAVLKIGAMAGLAKFASDAIDTANKTDKLDAAFKNLNGDTEETNRVLDNLKKMEFTTLFDFEDTLGPAAKNMMMLGVGADQAGAAVKALADAAAGMKLGPEYITQVSDSLATMQSHVQATQKDIKALAAEGAFSWTALTQVIGGTTEEAMAKVKEGLVSAKDVTTSVTNYLESRWSGQAEAVMGSWKGAMHILSETTEDARAALGESLKSVLTDLKPILTGLSAAIKDVADVWKDLPPLVQTEIIALVGFLAILPAVTSAVTLLGKGVMNLSAAFIENPMTAVIAAATVALVLLGNWVHDHWDGVKAAFDYILKGGSAIGVFGAFTAAEDKATAAAKAQQKLIDDQKKAATDAANAAIEEIKKTKEREAAEIAAAKASAAGAQALKDEEEALKATADAQAKYVTDLNKGYDALKQISPEAAKLIQGMGDVKTEANKAADSFGVAWNSIDEATKRAIISAYTLADALKAMGVAGESSLSDKVAGAADAYAALGKTAGATYTDMVAGQDKVLAATQALTDYQNTELKDAYDRGKITINDYYSLLESRAAAALADTEAAAKVGMATDAEVYAAKVISAKATKQLNDQTEKDLEAAYSSLGLKTQKQLDDAEAAAEKLAKLTAGVVVPAAEAAAAAFGKMGVTTLDAQVASVDKFAKSLVDAQVNADGSVSSVAALTAGAKKLDEQMEALALTISGQYKQAVKDGRMTQADADAATIQDYTDLIAKMKLYSDGGAAASETIAAAEKKLNDLHTGVSTTAVHTLKDAYHDLGIQSADAVHNFAVQAEADYQAVADAAGADAVATKQAWITKTQDAYADILAQGGKLTSDQKSELDKRKQDLQNHLDSIPSMYQTTYDGVKTAVTNTFDALEKKLVTGDGSFKDIMTGMWQSIAESALHAFLAPVEDAIGQFIAGGIADLMKSLGGVQDKLTSLGTSMAGIFTSAGKGASGAASDITTAASDLPPGTLDNPLAGLGGALPPAAGAGSAGSAAGSAVSAGLSSVMGIVGAVGSVVSAISGIISNFQMAKQETTLNAIEQSTRYSALLLGMQGDGGIHAKIAEIRDSLNGGGHVWWELDTIRDNLNTHLEPLHTNSDKSYDALSNMRDLTIDIRAANFDMRDSLQSIADSSSTVAKQMALTVNVSPSGITTAEAAKALADQIAANMAAQLAHMAP